MNKRMDVTKAIIEKNRLLLHIDESVNEIEGLKPKGQMLVDSDRLSFIYLLETDEDFIYTGLPHPIWPQLKEAKDQQLKVILMMKNQEIELIQLVDELTYLLDNIKGNANYGDEMEQKVIELFSLEK